MHRLVLIVALTACAPSLDTDDGNTTPTPSEAGAHVRHTEDGPTIVTVVDSSDEAAWVYLDLESKLEVDPEDPADSDAWDLALQRFTILTNGGISGSGGMAGAALADTALAEVERAPDNGWLEDGPDGDDSDMAADSVFSAWYAYDHTTHVLTPHPIVFVVRSVEGFHYAIAIEDYYDEAGTSGFPTLRWKPIDDPS
jgi:hypothetical protein